MGGRISHDLKALLVIEKTGWTYDDYLAQPEWVIDGLMLKWSADAERSKRESRTR